MSRQAPAKVDREEEAESKRPEETWGPAKPPAKVDREGQPYYTTDRLAGLVWMGEDDAEHFVRGG